MGAIKHIPYTHRKTSRPIGGDSGNLEGQTPNFYQFRCKIWFQSSTFRISDDTFR